LYEGLLIQRVIYAHIHYTAGYFHILKLPWN